MQNWSPKREVWNEARCPSPSGAAPSEGAKRQRHLQPTDPWFSFHHGLYGPDVGLAAQAGTGADTAAAAAGGGDLPPPSGADQSRVCANFQPDPQSGGQGRQHSRHRRRRPHAFAADAGVQHCHAAGRCTCQALPPGAARRVGQPDWPDPCQYACGRWHAATFPTHAGPAGAPLAGAAG